jgi:tetratricopeptide (TPR) repeat protein
MRSGVRRVLGLALLGAALLLSGCAAGLHGVRPVMTVDGQHMDFTDPVERARGLVATGQYGLAIDALSQIVHDEPGNVRALSLLAVTYAHLKRYDLSDRYHQQALLVDANAVAALNNWGYSYLMRGDTIRAVGLLERAAAVGKGDPVIAANLALATGRSGGTTEGVPPQTPPSPVAEQKIQLSDHVVLVRRTGQLRRIAPGVQLLVTKAPPAALEPEPDSPPRLISSAAGQPVDPRFAQFRTLFALFEGEQVAEMSSDPGPEPAPFAIVAEIDDFSTAR